MHLSLDQACITHRALQSEWCFSIKRPHHIHRQVRMRVGRPNAVINLGPSSRHSPFHLADGGWVDAGRPQKAIEVFSNSQ